LIRQRSLVIKLQRGCHSAGLQVNFEIERKFLVRGEEWRPLVNGQVFIRQAYLSGDGKASIRVRIKDNRTATLTIKSRPVELGRLELEYPIPLAEAEALIELRQGSVVEKTRHLVPCGDLTWEIDVFSGDNSGLVIAEIELDHAHRKIELPAWIGKEVTGQSEYYNSYLVQRPFCAWSGDGGKLTA
jgi:adenylate cyclase